MSVSSRLTRIVYFLLDVLELVLVIRFVLILFGASITGGFAGFIMGLTDPLIAPFSSFIPRMTLGSWVIEWSSLVAILLYGIIAYLLIRLITLFMPTTEVEERIVREEHLEE